VKYCRTYNGTALQLGTLPSKLDPLAHGHVALRDSFEKSLVGLVQHDVEVLHGVHALQTAPVLEPHHVLDLPLKSRLHVLVNLPMRLGRRQARFFVVLELKLGPHNQVHNVWVDAVRPVVVQDLDVVCLLLDMHVPPASALLPSHSNGLPLGTMLSHFSRSLTIKSMMLP
jgi:hypothetical protein